MTLYPAQFPSLLGSHLAMARKANSTFMPVLALVSMKGTPYSCQGESVLRTSLWLPPPLTVSTGSHLPWLASLRPLNVSPFHCSHLPVKPRWVTLEKEALAPAGPSPAPAGPSFPQEQALPRPLLVAYGTCKRYDWHGAGVSTRFRLSSPAPSPGISLPLGEVGNSPWQGWGDPASER